MLVFLSLRISNVVFCPIYDIAKEMLMLGCDTSRVD